MSIHIRVPATSANLGPGFDCLGLTLDIWNDLEVEVKGESLQIDVEGEGKNLAARDRSNAIFQAMLAYAQRHHRSLPQGLYLKCTNRIPFCSGLGSSAAAAVAGILAASAVLDLPIDLNDQLECANLIEGHPDNVAPCLMGGLVAAFEEDQQVIARNLPVANLDLLVAVPDFHFSTRASRANLPPEIPRREAIYNLGRLALLTRALAKGDTDLLAKTMRDKIHQPFRIPVIPGAEQAIEAAREAGAAAVALSGAGPSLLVILGSKNNTQKVANAVEAAFDQAGFKTRIFTPQIVQAGASLKIL